MRVPIYEALAHYKKNEELPYTEYNNKIKITL